MAGDETRMVLFFTSPRVRGEVACRRASAGGRVRGRFRISENPPHPARISPPLMLATLSPQAGRGKESARR
jgi:hypothetical protein